MGAVPVAPRAAICSMRLSTRVAAVLSSALTLPMVLRRFICSIRRCPGQSPLLEPFRRSNALSVALVGRP